MGHETTVCDAQWPAFNEEYFKEDTVTMGVSFNGKTRFTLDFPADATNDAIEQEVMQSQQAKKYLEGMQVVKVIVVPRKIVNIVLKK